MNFFRAVSRTLCGLLVVLCGAVVADDGAAPTANAAFETAQKIVTADGIELRQKLRLGGIDQWISIRGRHRGNPILLFLHGGPGFTSIPASYYYMQGWDEYFTVVQWDQRGAGRTYQLNDPEQLRPTMSVERMAADAEELAAWLRKTYGRRRIVLMAHSWGTVLGLKLAQRHPDWFYAYVGMGQFIDFRRSEALGYQATLAAARADHNQTAVSELESMAPFPDPEQPQRNLQNLGRERHWLEYYDGEAAQEHDFDIGRFSPEQPPQALQARLAGLDFSLQTLWPALSRVDLSDIHHLGCPAVFLQGRRDLSTNSSLLGQWYQTLDAPSKRLVWFDDGTHQLYEQEPGKTLVTLVQEVLPLTHSD